MNWVKVRTLKPGKVHFQEWQGPVEAPWEVAEQCMREGYLPPVVLCVLITKTPLAKFTRRRQWVLSGCLETLNWIERDTSDLRKQLKALRKSYKGRD